MGFLQDLAMIRNVTSVLTSLSNAFIAERALAAKRHNEILMRFDRVDQTQQKILDLFTPGTVQDMEFVFTNSATGETIIIKQGETMIALRNMTYTGSVKFYDSLDPATRNETTVDGKPTITLTPGPTDPNILMTVGDDGVISLRTNGKAGAALLTVEGDADLGSGVKPFQFTNDINVPAGEAIAGEVVFGEGVSNEPGPDPNPQP